MFYFNFLFFIINPFAKHLAIHSGVMDVANAGFICSARDCQQKQLWHKTKSGFAKELTAKSLSVLKSCREAQKFRMTSPALESRVKI